MTVPKHLNHKPVIAVNDYDKIDGHYAPKTDAKALSLGYAQYDEDEISAKVFRHTGKNWSRQSEELPIHRVLDLAILIVASMLPTPTKTNLNQVVIEPDGLKDISEYFKKHDKKLKQRLSELKNLLDILL